MCLVVINEAHIYSMHGQSFCDSIRVVPTALFYSLFDPSADYTPLFLAMMATLTDRLLTAFSALTHFDWSLLRHQLWSRPKEFEQCNIFIDFHVRGEVK